MSETRNSLVASLSNERVIGLSTDTMDKIYEHFDMPKYFIDWVKLNMKDQKCTQRETLEIIMAPIESSNNTTESPITGQRGGNVKLCSKLERNEFNWKPLFSQLSTVSQADNWYLNFLDSLQDQDLMESDTNVQG